MMAALQLCSDELSPRGERLASEYNEREPSHLLSTGSALLYAIVAFALADCVVLVVVRDAFIIL